MEQGGSAAGESGGIDFSTDIDLDQVGNRNRNLYCTLGQSGVGEQHVKRRGHSHLTVPVLPVVHLGGSQPRLLKLFEHVLHIAKLPPAVGGGHWRRVQPLGLRADHDLAQRSPGKQLHPAAECSAVQPPKHHLGPVRHQVGDLGASPPGEGDQQSRRAGGGDGVIVEEETHPPALATCLVLVLVGLTNLREAGYLMVSPTFTFLLPFRLSIMQWTIRNSLALDSNCDILDKYLVQKSNLDIFRQSFLCYFCNTNNAGPSVLM